MLANAIVEESVREPAVVSNKHGLAVVPFSGFKRRNNSQGRVVSSYEPGVRNNLEVEPCGLMALKDLTSSILRSIPWMKMIFYSLGPQRQWDGTP
jgi:hypothetical protein